MAGSTPTRPVETSVIYCIDLVAFRSVFLKTNKTNSVDLYIADHSNATCRKQTNIQIYSLASVYYDKKLFAIGLVYLKKKNLFQRTAPTIIYIKVKTAYFTQFSEQ